MQKGSASLLLIPVLCLFIEAVNIPPRFGERIAAQCCQKTAVQDLCAHAQPKKPKSAKNTCDSPNCLDCPLCNSVTLKPIIGIDPIRLLGKAAYSPMPEPRLSDYFSQPWKPPNFSFLS
jgi:hypothetical protein